MSNELVFKLRVDGAEKAASDIKIVAVQSDVLSSGLSRIGSSAAGLLGFGIGLPAIATGFVKAADAATILNNQLKLATGSSKAAAEAYAELYQIAQRSRTSFSELGSTYAAIARAGSELGVSQGRLLKVTEAIGNALAISGGSAEGARAALTQLGQGLASGTLRGEELNSVMEQTPRLAKAIADGLNIPIGKLREMGAAGELTAEQVLSALEKSASQLTKEVEGSVVTVGQAFTQLQNAALGATGRIDEATGASAGLASEVQGIAKSLETLSQNSTVLSVLQVSAQTAALLWSDLKFVVNGVGTEIGGVAAQLVQLAQGNFKAAAAIRGAMQEEAASARRQLDERQRAIVAPRSAATFAAEDSAGDERLIRQSREAVAVTRQRSDAESKLADIRQRLSGVSKTAAADAKALDQAEKAGIITAAEKVKLLGDLARKSAGAAKDQSPFADLTRDFEQQIVAINRRVAEGGNLTKAQELEIKLADKLQDATGKLTKAQLSDLQATAKRVVAAQEALDQRERDIKSAQQQVRNVEEMRVLREEGEREIYEFLRKQEQERAKSLQSITDQVQALKDEAAAADLVKSANVSLAEAVQLVALARQEESRAAKVNDPAALDALAREIDARKELLGLLGTKAAREANDKAAKDALDSWQRTADQIGQSLTDALMQGGKSAWEYIKGLFRSTVLRPIIQGVVNPIAGALTGGGLGLPGSAAAGGLGAPLGQANNLLGTITGSLTSSIAGLVSNAGSLLGSSALSTFATGMQGNALAAGLAGPTTAGAGGILGAGASFASAVPYLAGALALFSAKDALFGRKLKDTSITGTLGGEAGFTGATEQFFKGGLFRSNKTETKALDAAVADPLAASVQAIKKTVADYAGALNLPAEQIASFTQSIKFSTKDLSPEQVQAKLQEALSGFGDALAGTFAGELGPFQSTGEKAGQTLARLAGAISGVNPLLEQLGLKVFDVGLAGADAASQLAAQLGGLEGLSQTSSAYFQSYYSDAERAAKATEGITSVLGQVGLSLPATREEFRKLVEAQDLTTESGRNSFAALLKVSSAFAELTPAAEASAQAINAAAREQLAGAIDQNIGKFLSDTQRTAREYSSIAGSLSQAGVEVDIGKLIGLNKAEIFDLASAFVASADNTDAAKLAVVQAAGALADLKDQAAQAAQALDSQLASAIDANVDKFLTPRQSLERKAGAISGNLAAVGLNFSPEQLLGYSKDQIFDFAKSFVAATSNSQEAKIAVVEAAGALQDLAAALRDVKVNEFLQGLNLTADELLGAYRELTPAADNLVTAWRKSRTEMEALRDALAEIEGTKAVSALDQLRNTISQRDALKGVVGGIDSQLVSLRSGTGDAAALGYLRQREAALWKDFASTKNPAVAQAITDTTLQRIKLEGELQQQANASQITALKEQISAAERLRDVASQMGDFVLSLRAGSLSNLSAAGRQAAQQEILDKAIATGGDVQGAAQALLQLGQQRFGGATAQYSQLFDETQAKLLAFGSSAAGADAQITEAQAQLNALTSVADNSLAQITALESLRTAFGAEVQTLDASVREQLAVQRSALDQMVLMVTNQERLIMQLGEGLTRIIDGVERTADAAEGGALSGAEAEALGA